MIVIRLGGKAKANLNFFFSIVTAAVLTMAPEQDDVLSFCNDPLLLMLVQCRVLHDRICAILDPRITDTETVSPWGLKSLVAKV